LQNLLKWVQKFDRANVTYDQLQMPGSMRSLHEMSQALIPKDKKGLKQKLNTSGMFGSQHLRVPVSCDLKSHLPDDTESRNRFLFSGGSSSRQIAAKLPTSADNRRHFVASNQTLPDIVSSQDSSTSSPHGFVNEKPKIKQNKVKLNNSRLKQRNAFAGLTRSDQISG
jgi:hypothetical protein